MVRVLALRVLVVRLLVVRLLVVRLAVRTFLGAAGALYRRTSLPPIEAIRREALFACL